MHYQQLRASRPPPVFELRVKASLAQLAAAEAVALPAPYLSQRLLNYIQSLLLAENLPPTPHHLTLLIGKFLHLVAQTDTGKPLIYRKRNTISLLFDIFAVQSEMCIDSPDDLVLGYTQSMMGFLLFKPDTKEIGMIGLGGGSLTKFCYRHLPAASIAVAEIDPRVIELRSQFRIPEDDHRLRVHCMDGSNFVQLADSRFDVLMVDGFDRQGQPAQLCSQRFYDDCYTALAPDGILVINLLGDPGDTQILVDRIGRSFDGAAIVIDAADCSNKIVFACKGSALDVSDHDLRVRISALELRHPAILSVTMEAILRQRYSTAWSCLMPRQQKTAA